MTKIDFGTVAPFNPLEESIRVAKKAEECEFSSVWLGDHLVAHLGSPACLEAWTVMGIISQHTEKIRLGVGVTDPHRRNPALLAQTAATVDIASNGRLIMGIGAGEAMNLEPFGIPWNRPVSRMAEAMPLMQRLWSERYIDHEGEFYSMHNAIVEPKPVQKPHPPMWLAANGPRTLRLCGEHCQGWLPGRINPSTYADDLEVIEDYLKVRDGQPPPTAWHITHKGHPHLAQTKDCGGHDAGDDEDQSPGHARRREAQHQDQDQR